MNKNIFFLLCIILFTIIIYYSKLNNRHLFWNETQPIYDVLHDERIIKNVKELKVVDPLKGMNMIKFDKNNIDIFIRFINKHFDQSVIYTNDYIHFNCGNNSILFGIEKDNILIGTISGKYTSIIVNKKKYKSIYVDYLCIHKEYRDCHYAPILISIIIKHMKTYNYPTAFYRLDSMKHHFKHFYESYYYYYKLIQYDSNKSEEKKANNYHITSFILDINDMGMIHRLYSFYLENISLFQIYENITEKEFYFKIKNKISTTIIFTENDNIVGFITYLNTTYNIFENRSPVIEIYYFIFSNNKYSDDIIYLFLKQIPSTFEYLYLLNNFYNNKLVNYLKMSKTDISYFYLYNYFLKNGYYSKNCLLF